ncbi:MAG: hypothetical protein HY722_06405 [Planctomycetes bacterium]|nr:hypothetical protein [Planctomycetota bacterium]
MDCLPRATFNEDAVEVDPAHFPGWALADPVASRRMPELADAFHPDRHAFLRAVLQWASDQGQALLVGPVQGDYDIHLPQVHLNLELPMIGEGYAPYGYLHLVLHDFMHHFLGHLRVRGDDLARSRLRETRKRIHQAAMLGEVVATFSTVSRVISDYSNWRARALGEGREGQFGGFWSFVPSEREVCRGWKAFYIGGRPYTGFLRRELRREVILEKRRAGDYLVWPPLAWLLGAGRGGPGANLCDRVEAALMERLGPRLLSWAYWDRSVYSVADFQQGCRHLADRHTSAWHVAWQADFDDGEPFETVLGRCRSTFRGLVRRDHGYFREVPQDLGPGGYPVNVRREQARMFARKLYELGHHIGAGRRVYTGDAGGREGWRRALDEAADSARCVWRSDPARTVAAFESFRAVRSGLLQRWRRERDLFRLGDDRHDFLENPNRFLFDPGVRDANVKPPRRRTWAELRAGLRRWLLGRPVSLEERAWTREVLETLDTDAAFDEAEAAGIPTAGRIAFQGEAGAPIMAAPWPRASTSPAASGTSSSR